MTVLDVDEVEASDCASCAAREVLDQRAEFGIGDQRVGKGAGPTIEQRMRERGARCR